MTKFYVTPAGVYVGGFYGAEPPIGSIEVPTAPDNALDLWDGANWVSAPTPIPQSVTMRQARLALLGAGKLVGVTAAINALPSPQKEAAQIEWEYSQTVERNRGFVLLLSAALGLTDAQLDAIFVTAARL